LEDNEHVFTKTFIFDKASQSLTESKFDPEQYNQFIDMMLKSDAVLEMLTVMDMDVDHYRQTTDPAEMKQLLSVISSTIEDINDPLVIQIEELIKDINNKC
jgi:hypothetical protein